MSKRERNFKNEMTVKEDGSYVFSYFYNHVFFKKKKDQNRFT